MLPQNQRDGVQRSLPTQAFFKDQTQTSKHLPEYQGVKKFHMVAHIGAIVSLWLSVLSNLKSHIIIHPRATNNYAPSDL